MRIPILVYGGEADSMAPPPTNAMTIAREVPGARLVLLPFTRHYSFLSTGTPLGRSKAAELCADERGLDRDELPARVSKEVGDFFDATLAPPGADSQ